MKLLVTTLLFLTFYYSAAQSPWTLKKGDSYLQLNYSNISNYNEIFGNPDYQTERNLTDNTLQFYGEYGINDKTTLVGSVPFKFIKSGGLTLPENLNPITISDEVNGLGNIIIGAKHKIIDEKWIVTAQLYIESNTSSYDNSSGIRTGYNAWSVLPIISFGRGYSNLYIQLFSGIDLKTNNYSSNFKLGGEIGVKVLKPLWLIGYIDIVQSFKNGEIKLPISNNLTALYVNNQSFGGYGLKAILEITKRTGITTSFGGAFFGNNVAKKVALNFGLFQKF